MTKVTSQIMRAAYLKILQQADDKQIKASTHIYCGAIVHRFVLPHEPKAREIGVCRYSYVTIRSRNKTVLMRTKSENITADD